MRRLIQFGCLAAVAGLALLFARPAVTAPAEDAALKLWNSLSEDQRKEALLPWDSKERYKEEFPAVKRPGLAFAKLSKEQKELVFDAMKAVTTEYGTERALKISKETPDSARYLTFYGTPAKGKPFAWRAAMHHLTLIYAEFGQQDPGEFGPILLGGNPTGTMWDAEDDLFRELYATLSEDEKKTAGKGKGIEVGKLNDKAKGLAGKLLNKRLEVFNPDYRKNFDVQLKRDGGIDKLHLNATAKDASKSHHQGGRYSWRLAGNHVFCDWVIIDNNHLHLTLRASPVKKAG